MKAISAKKAQWISPFFSLFKFYANKNTAPCDIRLFSIDKLHSTPMHIYFYARK